MAQFGLEIRNAPLRDREILQQLLLIRSVSQRELAKAAGWSSHSYVGRLVRGQASAVAPAAAWRIAERLGVRLEELFVTR